MAEHSKDQTKISAREINDTIRYTCWAVYTRTGIAPAQDATVQLDAVLKDLEARDVLVRGWYDVSGLRADADVMIWLHAPAAEFIQQALRDIRRAGLDEALSPSWSAMALHRPAEFNKGHVPAFMTGAPAKEWVCVYPFVRSYEWYLLPEEERPVVLHRHDVRTDEERQHAEENQHMHPASGTTATGASMKHHLIVERAQAGRPVVYRWKRLALPPQQHPA